MDGNNNENGDENVSKMKTWHKCLLASLGALMPLIMSLYFAEFEVFSQKVTLPICLGYTCKVVILILLGALIGYFYRSETSGMKLFQLGIAAPTIILGLINGQTLGQSNKDTSHASLAPFLSVSLLEYHRTTDLSGELQDSVIHFQEVEVNHYSYPEETVQQEIKRGFTGTKITNNWFLIYESYADLHEGQRITVELRNKYPNLNVQLYNSVIDPERFDVVVGEYLDYKEGVKMQKEYSKRIDKYLVLWEFNRPANRELK